MGISGDFGFKFVYFNGTDTLNLYNLNYSLFKSIVIPGNWGSYPGISFISEGLFDTDTSHVEYMITTTGGPVSFAIYKDNGTLVFGETNAYAPSVVGNLPGFSSPIFNSDSGTFMIVTQVNSSSRWVATQFYKLGGKLPCLPGCLGGAPPLGIENIGDNQFGY